MSNRTSRSMNRSSTRPTSLSIDDLIKTYFDKKNGCNPEQPAELENIKAKLDSILGILDDKNHDQLASLDFRKTSIHEKVSLLKSIMNSLFSKYKVSKDLSLSHLFTSRLQRLLLQQSQDYSASKIDFESFKQAKPVSSELSKEPFKLENNEYTQISHYNSLNNDPSFFEQWLSNKSQPSSDNKLAALKIIFRRVDSFRRIEMLKFFYVIKNVQPKKQYLNFHFRKLFFVLNSIVVGHYKAAWSQMNFCNTLTPIHIQEMSAEMSYTLEDINNLNFQKKGFQQPIMEESNESMSQIKSTIEFFNNEEQAQFQSSDLE